MVKQRIDLLLLVEHNARELDVSCAVKYLMAEKYGVDIEIASIVDAHGFQKTIAKYQPRVVTMPYFYSESDFGPHKVLQAWPEATIVNLAYEQIFSKINQAYKAPKGTIAKKHVLHHAWGKFYAAYLEEYGVPREHIFINGNPFYALYQPPYSSYFDSKGELAKRYGIDPHKRWVFVPENYGAAFYGDAKLKEYLKAGQGDAFNYRDFAMSSFKEAIKWWQEGTHDSNVEIIVRPRPATPRGVFINTCRESLGQDPAMHIIKEGTVREWVLASDIVMSSYSTTLIEAAVANKPIYMIEPIHFPDYVQADWYDLVPQIETLQRFLEVIGDPAMPNTCQPLQTWAHEALMNSANPIGDLANWLAAICKGEIHVPTRPDPALLPAPVPPPGRVPKNLKGWLRLPGKIVDYAWRKITHPEIGTDGIPISDKLDEITDAEVAGRVANWRKVFNSIN
jgi:surface carbohydrate biosynthesis protein